MVHLFDYIYSQELKTLFILPTTAPGFVGGIHALATQSSIKIYWTIPTTSSGEVMSVDRYYINYLSQLDNAAGFDYNVEETVETEYEVSDLSPNTYSFFTIEAEYQGKTGPEVSIGTSTGNPYIVLRATCNS